MTPTRNEILGALCTGFLMLSVGVVWMFGALALVICGATVFLATIALGFVDLDKNKEE